ncbi:MAG: hypothetical protein EBZ43_11120, partial [Betaproteobacteria bacterium]|nr:hypothetical protein [Betaproteobacteria bacterium]
MFKDKSAKRWCSELGARQAHARRPLVKARPTVASIGLVMCLSDVLQRSASAMCFSDVLQRCASAMC